MVAAEAKVPSLGWVRDNCTPLVVVAAADIRAPVVAEAAVAAARIASAQTTSGAAGPAAAAAAVAAVGAQAESDAAEVACGSRSTTWTRRAGAH